MGKYGQTRRMTVGGEQTASIAPSALSSRRNTVGGPVMVPADLTPQQVAKSKNESIFTRSLLSGDQPGYAHLHGGAKAAAQ